MNWHDLFYFSKGERQALTVLLILITLSWFTLQLKEDIVQQEKPIAATTTLVQPVIPASKEKQNHTPAYSHKKTNNSFKKKSGFLSNNNKTSFGKKRIYNEKFKEGTIVDLNTADTTTLKKVPGIGSTFARRIVKYRSLLGGFYSVAQLSEVYGIDEERYEAIKPWFSINISAITLLKINNLPIEKLNKHPYISYKQARAIKQQVKQKGRLTGWENLQLLEEFTETDKERILPYLSFE